METAFRIQPIDEALSAEGKELLKGRKNGTVSHANVVDWFKESFRDSITGKLRLWMEGELFAAQKQSFDAWLGIEKNAWFSEVYRANEALGILGAAEEMPKDMLTFCNVRIFTPGYSVRAHVLEAGAKSREMALDVWVKQNKRFNWDWR